MSFVNCGTDDSSGTMTRLIDETPSRDPRRGLTSPALGYIRAYHIRGERSACVLSPEKGACDMRAFRMRIVHALSRGCKGAAEGEDEERSWMATHGSPQLLRCRSRCNETRGGHSILGMSIARLGGW